MNTSEKRRPGPGNSSAHTLRTGVPNPNRNSMPAMPPRAAMAANTVSSPEETIEGGAPLTERKEKDATATRSGSVKDKDREKERKERREKREKKERDRELEAALKEKDEKIAYLEKEMGIMEREFHRELDKLSQNESETATFWQAKHSALNQQFLRTDTELRLLRAEVEVREGEREELREGWEVLRRELKERDNEIRGLRGQTCDEVFGDGMARLGNGLQNWVIVNFRKAKIKLDELDEATLAEINELVPMYEDLASTAKVHLLQSIVSRILVEMVFDAYFVGLSSEQTQQFRQMEKMLYSYGGEDEEALTEREICCVAFPGVIKHGDENGGHLQFRNVIVKARVLCSPE
ncbi:hypothetical protein BHE90_002182 [Fusarium euwallaceae]|uniref:Uncharacterized protein n=1 Tax=Fusarium euwallaceae TaxID=1147111 RepID=A0A430M610_9HYPO|nr:hypothetical protein BHE90_002182 [Fusarium euwallaceae]